MPDKVGPPRQSDALTFTLGVRRVEQAQLDSGRMLGENREVRAAGAPATVPRRAQWVGAAREDLSVGFGSRLQIDGPRTAGENAIQETDDLSEPPTTILTNIRAGYLRFDVDPKPTGVSATAAGFPNRQLEKV